MLTFLALTLLGLAILAGGAIFGHDHDHDAHFDHDHDHDHGHDAGHEGEPTVSIFSLKVIGAFIAAFGAGGAIATWSGYGLVQASLIGLTAGFLLAGFMYLILWYLYKQQSNSSVYTEEAIGKTGVVSVEIDPQAVGSVDIYLAGQNRNYLARSSTAVTIPKGCEVIVVRTNGSELVVEARSSGAH